jgi:predicted enzyme related to lactoylglutathione lyase
MIGSENPKALTDYYTKVFGKPGFEEDGIFGWQIGGGFLTVIPHDQVKGKNQSPGRILWNLESDDVVADFEKLKAAGATVVVEPYHPSQATEMWVATFSDPDDNYFQLTSQMEAPPG